MLKVTIEVTRPPSQRLSQWSSQQSPEELLDPEGPVPSTTLPFTIKDDEINMAHPAPRLQPGGVWSPGLLTMTLHHPNPTACSHVASTSICPLIPASQTQ